MSNDSRGTQIARVLDGQGTIAQKLNSPTIATMIESKLRGGVTLAEFQASALQAATDPALSQCSPVSLFMSIIKVAELGLLPGSTAKHVALIPRAGSIDVQPMFRGYLYLMRKIPGVANVECVLVHDTDTLVYDHESRQVVRHEYPADPFSRGFYPPTKSGLQGTGLRGGYCRFIFADGTVRDLLCPGEHIIKAMGAAKTKNVWSQWFELMALKTVANYACARLPTFLDVDQGPLAYIEAVRDHDNTLSVVDEPEAPKATADQRSGQDALRERLQASRKPEPEPEPAVADDWDHTLDSMDGGAAAAPVASEFDGKSNTELLQLVAALNGVEPEVVLFDLTKDCAIDGCTHVRALKALAGDAAQAARDWLLSHLEAQ